MATRFALLNPHALSSKPVFCLGLALTLVVTFLTVSHTSVSTLQTRLFNSQAHIEVELPPQSQCSPEAWADGHWMYHPRSSLKNATNAGDLLDSGGFSGCACSREYDMQLGSDTPEQLVKQPKVDSYQWVPSENCNISALDGKAMVKQMVEEGGWLLLGGRLTSFRDDKRPNIFEQTLLPETIFSRSHASSTRTFVPPRITTRVKVMVLTTRSISTSRRPRPSYPNLIFP
jgi:hypothetical protein